jgi:hypothetical protein
MFGEAGVEGDAPVPGVANDIATSSGEAAGLDCVDENDMEEAKLHFEYAAQAVWKTTSLAEE